MYRRDVEDAAPVTAAHAGQSSLSRIKGARQIDGEDLLPLRSRESLHWRGELNTGVIDQNVEAPKGLLGVVNKSLDLVWLAHVTAMIAHRVWPSCVLFLQHVLCGLDRVFGPEAIDHNVGPSASERTRNREPDP
eukprot:Amastigsp_a508640_261.p2 type:complete len:134 gc:universal Amastigsp_a508640_261:467-66(-)